MWRRALLSMVAMLSCAAIFVGVVMLVLGSVVDMAVAPASDGENADTVESAAADTVGESKGRSKSSKSKGPKGPGERS